ncbi:NADH-quinone oxidoreductase subunit NuoN [Paenibacillus lutrae]|uniref:NADH-quinone oxidoreductase subunit N n=1 Tax=Paenibacillus lutrae TaxID=2078573 RepID=A0A7X3FKR5_9BACL|nr:NADH-quinone oxidoreductase subunit NuoN [Paenibacillus lutrae]
MGPIRLHLQDLTHLLPEITLVVTAVLLTVIDLLLPKKIDRRLIGWLSLAGIAVSTGFVIMQMNPAQAVSLLSGSYRIDDFGNLLKLVFLGGTALITLMSLGSVEEKDIPHIGEYYYFLLPAVLGAMIMASSSDLITLFVGLELLSITSYVMVAMKKKDTKSNEAAFKYVVLGGISSAIILYGMSFLYGMSGSTNLAVIQQAIISGYSDYKPLLYVAVFLLLAGFGFKIAAAPFHSWAPDVYQGAPTPITAFLAVVSKGAAFAILFRVFYALFALGQFPEDQLTEDVFLALSVVAAAAMVVGNTAALRQRNVKRLLAYSGVANAGYLLVPLAVHINLVQVDNFSKFLFYLIAYLLMNIGLFAVLIVIEKSTGDSDLKGFAGLYYRAPFTAIATILLILSLSGIPVSAGFFGKLYLLIGTMQAHMYWLGGVMIITGVLSFYYYFGLIRQMFMRVDTNDRPIRITTPLGIVIWFCAGISLALGIFPGLLLRYIDSIFSLTRDLLILS